MTTLKAKSRVLNEQLSDNLKVIRNDQRFTMRALADRLNTPHSFIGKTEQLNRRLDVGEFIHYCLALEVNPVNVLKELVKDID